MHASRNGDSEPASTVEPNVEPIPNPRLMVAKPDIVIVHSDVLQPMLGKATILAPCSHDSGINTLIAS